ncbi:hypothetical protein BFP72_01870 [Reichenbachiella sp. 5M10]|uniref:IPT/TIG domain-containing protein n=1 Tax=Reichenbachiella sp. 5M10 TaxID=1889772 RepID=UPI000C15211D|nr:IPT/TIG domain-containing protein [Reichenbachiella sp. 5M10]PIB34266.1 hypothetical protein BFP72_01870 [Reichenbachiella sp. 5M10]
MYKILSKNVKIKSTWAAGALILFASVFVSCSEDEGDTTAPIPTITAISVESGEPGDAITITGTDLDDAESVTFGGVPATITSNSTTEIVTSVPEDGVTGKIRVTTPGGVAETQVDFSVIVVGAAVVSEISPKSAQIGEQITITGTDMLTVTSVKIGEVEATVASTTETTAIVTIAEGSALGLSTLTIVNDGGTATTSTEMHKFYVIKMIDEIYQETFDSEDPNVIGMTGSADVEESTVHGLSIDVSEDATDLPPAIDGTFFHMEGYSSTEISTSYMAQLGLRTQDVGTFADFFGDNLDAKDVYFNIQINFGELPEGYTESEGAVVAGLRFRFEGDDYEWQPTLQEIHDMGYEADENGWYSLSVPATAFDDDAAIGTFDFKDMTRYAVAQRRNYGTGTALPLGPDTGSILATLSFDNVSISIGGPLSY